jgi:osmoprotectant transport system permease protein
VTPALAAALAGLPPKLAAHVALSAAALALAIVVAAPLVLLARSRPRLRWTALGLAGLVQTIPALALLALFYPALLAVRGVTGGSLPVLGFLPALLALALYALLPLLRGGIGGLLGVDADVIEAANGVGMTARQRLFDVELPLAAPVILGGVRTAAVWTILAAIAAAAVIPSLGGAPAKPVVVGAKNFSEQYILADLIAARLAPRAVVQRSGLGSAVAFRALAAGDVDVYVDYAGTLWTGILGHSEKLPRADLLAALTRELGTKYGVGVVGPLGFENAYVLAVRRDTATRLHLKTIADLARAAPGLTLGADIEFLSRPEWAGLDAAYHLAFRAKKSFEPTFMYRALASGEADVISAFSSDGRIAAQDLVVLTDPLGAIPSYDALLLVSPTRAKDHALDAALRPLVGAIDVAAMRRANLLVDRDADKLSPAAAARTLEGERLK